MKTIKSLITKLSIMVIFILSNFTIANAQEINTSNFSGSLNTTVTSGFQIRVSDRDCELMTGYNYTSSIEAYGTITSGNKAGCSGYRTDAYGNTSTEYIDLGNKGNGDDGNLNYSNGSIVNATQQVYTELTGDANGVGVNLSFIGSYNPVNDINAPEFKKLKSIAQSSLEQDYRILNANINFDLDFANGDYANVTIGKNVTTWGESTFIPIGFNGLVSQALDISKLRSPGASIKEALIPNAQIAVSMPLTNGFNVEAYYQLEHSSVKLEEAGSFFGNEVVGKGEAGLVAGGANGMERLGVVACPIHLTEAAGGACTTTTRANALAGNYTQDYYSDLAYDNLSITQATVAHGFSASKVWGSESLAHNSMENISPAALYAMGLSFGQLTTQTNAGEAFNQSASASVMLAGLQAVGQLTPIPQSRMAGVQINPDQELGKFQAASDSGEFGLKLSKYFDNINGGTELAFQFANYHSKTPYIRFKGKANLHASDLYGLYSTAAFDYLDNGATALASFDTGGDNDGLYVGTTAGDALISAIRETAYSSVICSAVLGKAMAYSTNNSIATSKYTVTAQERDAYMNAAWSTTMEGEANKVHNPSVCYATATAANAGAAVDARWQAAVGTNTYADTGKDVHLALMGTGASILAAITPLNYVQYQFVYPEDNKIFSGSFSTVVDGTVVQGELAYRPNFPLATPTGSQIQQMSDAAGTTQMLNWTAMNGIDGIAQTVATDGDATADGLQVALATQILMNSGGNALSGSTDAWTNGIRDFKRSSLTAITDITSDYFSTPWLEYDVATLNLATTTAFAASHPITQAFGADSTVLLTEAGMVKIMDLNNANGYVARGGASEGGDDPTKCMGAFGTSMIYGATKSVDALGSANVDSLFGNGGYCEDNPGAHETAFTYRVIGSASYNNVLNTPWSVSPNFAWSHDPSGYGPSSLGGFVEGRMSLSLGVNATKGAVKGSLSYVNQMGDATANNQRDKDTISASVSYAF